MHFSESHSVDLFGDSELQRIGQWDLMTRGHLPASYLADESVSPGEQLLYLDSHEAITGAIVAREVLDKTWRSFEEKLAEKALQMKSLDFASNCFSKKLSDFYNGLRYAEAENGSKDEPPLIPDPEPVNSFEESDCKGNTR